MKPYRGFANLIRQRRKDLALTLSDVAAKMGWSVPYMSEMERGIKPPPPNDGIRRLSTILDIPLRDLTLEAEMSRRSVEIDIEGASSNQRLAAVLFAKRFEQGGISDNEASQLVAWLEQRDERWGK